MAEKEMYKTLGRSGLNKQGSLIYDEFLPNLRFPHAAKVYQEMADNDAVVASILYLAEMLIRRSNWSVEPADDTPEEIEKAEFLESCMNDMDSSWANTISEIISMLTYGFSFHEVIYKIRRGPNEKNSKYNSKYTDGKIGWKRIPIRAQRSLDGWEFNEEGDVIAFIQKCEPDYKEVRIPLDKGLLFRTRVSRDNPEGKSLLRGSYRSWYFKKHFEEIEGIGIERDLAGFPVLTVPESLDIWQPDDEQMLHLKATAEKLVSSIRRDSEEGLVLPYGWELKLLTSGSSRQLDISNIIERYDNRIAITMLSDIILIGGTKSGSFALADNKQSMLSAALQAQLENIADVFNDKAVPKLFKVNGYNDLEKLPKIIPGTIQTPDISEVSLLLRAMGLNIAGDKPLQDHLRRILDLPKLTDDVFNEVYKPQERADYTERIDVQEGDDTIENVFEQNNMNNV